MCRAVWLGVGWLASSFGNRVDLVETNKQTTVFITPEVIFLSEKSVGAPLTLMLCFLNTEQIVQRIYVAVYISHIFHE